MIGMVIVTHGRLAEELRHALEHVVGPQRNMGTICIGPDDDSGSRYLDVQHEIEAVDGGDGVVLLTDMFGGTPSNLCIAQMVRPGVEVLAGVNLPMLVQARQGEDGNGAPGSHPDGAKCGPQVHCCCIRGVAALQRQTVERPSSLASPRALGRA